MNHVTDDRADRPLGPDLHDWLEGSIEELPDGSELPSPIRSDVLSRLPVTPQRRRWWPFRWFPFGFGATRSAEAEEPRPEGRPKSMFTATRVAAAVAILALAGSLALVVSPFGDDPVSPPGAPMDDIDPAAFGGFSGTMTCAGGDDGSTTTTDWGSMVKGETYPRCTLEVSDARISGNKYSVHDYYKYDGMPVWGVRAVGLVVANEDGTWVSDEVWGYQQPEDRTMVYAEKLRGTDAYEGLTALMIMTQDTWGLSFDVQGVIFPGDLPEAPAPPIEEALAAD